MKRFISLFLFVMLLFNINVSLAQEFYEKDLMPKLPAGVDLDSNDGSSGETSEEAEDAEDAEEASEE